MRIEEAFHILGTAPVKDEAAIKNAYRKKLSSVNPEDDQEGFKRLRKAYEEACSYARKEEGEKEKEDTTPSGLWVRQAFDLYGRFHSRCDEEAWRRLFQEELFISLEGYEECRKKLLIFFMTHFQFPHKIWQLFDKYLNICEDRNRLKEEFPTDFIQFIVQRCMEKEAVDFSLFQGPDEGDYDLFLNYYREGANALNRQDYEEALQAAEKADATEIFHPYMEIVRALANKGGGRDEEAGELLMQLREQYPDNGAVLFHVSNYFWDKERKDEAWECCLKLKEQENGNYMANYRLAFYYYERKDYRSAEECIKLVSNSPLTDEMKKLLKDIHAQQEQKLQKRWKEEEDMDAAMELAGNYYQEERYYAAGKVLEAVGGKMPEERKAEYLLFLAKVYLGQAENEKAVETVGEWQESAGEKEQENRYTAIRLKISAYHMMGRRASQYYNKAEEEYKKIKDRSGETPLGSQKGNPELLMEMTQIYLEKKEYQKCIDLSEILLDEYRIYFAYVFMLKAYAGLWDGAGVIRCGRKCIEYFPAYAYPYEEMAKVYYDTGHSDELKELLDLVEKKKIESCYLDNCAYHGEKPPENFPINHKLGEFDEAYYFKISMTGNLKYYREGYPVITRYLKMYPCSLLLNKRGLFSMAAKDGNAAMKDFQKILERDPADAFAHNNIGCLYKYSGEYEKAMVYFKKAVYYMYREDREEPVGTHYINLAHTYELMGEYRQAAEVYRRLYDEFQKSETAIRGLTANYARTGKLREAKSIIENIYADNLHGKELQLYRVYLYAGEFARAFRRMRIWKILSVCSIYPAMSLEYRSKYNHMLAWELAVKGRTKKAVRAVRQALESFRGNKKDRIDMALNQIFFLTIQADMEKEGTQEKIKDGLEQLEKILKEACPGGKKDGESFIETEAFFYKERYVKYIDFILALYGQGMEKGEKACEAMEQSPRCRNCNQASCMRLKTAKALLLERQGEKRQALDVYRQLAGEQPYNLYARAKLRRNEVEDDSWH